MMAGNHHHDPIISPDGDQHRQASIEKLRPLHPWGFGFIVIRENSNAWNAKSPRVFEVMDG
jgi:hypothetical protein